MPRWIASGIAALAIVVAIGWWLGPPPPAPVERYPSGAGALDYADALTRADNVLEGAVALADGHRDEWLFQERLANAYIAHGRLIGSFADYAAAQSALRRAFALAPRGAGPHQTQAALDMTLHRLGPAAAMLDAIDHYAVPAEAETRTEIGGTRGDIAFYHGDYAQAGRLYAAADPQGTDPGILYRIANVQAHIGQPDTAIATLDRIERNARLPQAQFLADLALRRGAIELQRGAWDKAAAHFDRAARLFPGWWLADAHRAQMIALRGDIPVAIARFEAIQRHNDSPELEDALAALYRAQGDAKHAAFWRDRARTGWNERLRLFPEAARGHAIEHILAFGKPADALPLAQADAAARPYGQTRTALAWTLIANNRPADALKAIAPVLRSGWVSGEANMAAAQAHLLLGESDLADRAQAAALAINPRAADPAAALIWFGH